MIQYEMFKKRDSAPLKQRIEKLGIEAKITPMSHLWLIRSQLDSSEIRDQLLPFIDAKDKLFVVRVDTDDWASWNLNDKEVSWLNQHISVSES